MPQFSYRALTKSGELVAGDLAAPSRAEVVARLDYLGLLPVETREVAASAPQQSAGRFGRRRARAEHVTEFARHFAFLLAAGLRLDQALDLLVEPDISGPLAPTVTRLRAQVGAGETLAEALAAYPDLFPPIFVSLVGIGQASGTLPPDMRALAEMRAKGEPSRQRIPAAFRHP
eukprot:gene33395-38813_t